MAKFIQAPTKVCNFDEAIQFMNDRMNYYENDLHEPSDWECSVEFEDDKLWIKQVGENFFDTMLESENKRPGLRVTTPMDINELKDCLGKYNSFKYICGPLYNGF